MLKIEKAPNHVIAFGLVDVLEQKDIAALQKVFQEKLRSQERICLLMDMTKWTDVTSAAIAADAKFEFGLIGQLNRFEKVAVITDKQFVEAAMRFMNPLFPTIDVKCFGPDEHDKALAFVSELPTKRPALKSATKLIDTGSPKIIGYEIDGTMTREDVHKIVEPLEKAFKSNNKIDLFVRMRNYAGFDPTILTESSFMSMKLSAINHIRRYAVVGAKDWMKNAAGFFASMLPIEMKFFDASQEKEAWAWLKS